jgi:hypothetical protein
MGAGNYCGCGRASAVQIGITPAIAEMATSLPASFPRDPADRLIYATASSMEPSSSARTSGFESSPFPTHRHLVTASIILPLSSTDQAVVY